MNWHDYKSFLGYFLFSPMAEPNRPNSWFRWCCHCTPIFSMVRDTGMETKIWFLKVLEPIALCCYVTARCDYRRRRRNDEKNVILPLKFSLKGALSHTVVPTLPWLLSHHIFGHIYIFTEFSFSFSFTSLYVDVVSVFYPESKHCTVVVKLWQFFRLIDYLCFWRPNTKSCRRD